MKDSLFILFWIKSFLLLFAITPILGQTGIEDLKLSNCDGLVLDFLNDYEIPGASIAIAKDGKVIYNRGFGYADLQKEELTQPNHLFRIASLSKPITSIAIMKLYEQQKLNLSDKVFGENGLLQNHLVLKNALITDTSIYQITVQNLLEHTAGWDREVNCFPNPTTPYPWFFSGCDPIVVPLHIADLMEADIPIREEDLILFLLKNGLDFIPSTKYAYSNIGYLVLGEIIEELSGLTYEEFIKTEILSPLGICNMHLGKNLLADKLEREVEYFGNGYTTLSSYDTGELVPWEYGGFNLEAMDAHGGWIANSRDLVKLLLAVDNFDTKPDILSSSTLELMTSPSTQNINYAKGWSVNSSNNWWHTGALDGTASFFARTNNGFAWAILMNKRIIGDQANQFWRDFDNLPWSCLKESSTYPDYDLLNFPVNNSPEMTFTNVTDSSVTVQCKNNSNSRRILVAKKGSYISTIPFDGIDYTDNSRFAFGDEIGDNTFVIYDGMAESIIVSNLTPRTKYTFSIYEYNQGETTGNYKLYSNCNNPQTSTYTEDVSTSNYDSFDKGITIFPTITKNHIKITTKSKIDSEYRIFNIMGVLVQSGSLTCAECIISIMDLSAGLYFIEINSIHNNKFRSNFIIHK